MRAHERVVFQLYSWGAGIYAKLCIFTGSLSCRAGIVTCLAV